MGDDRYQWTQALKVAACVVIVAYGIRLVSHLLSILLLSLLFAYIILPLPQSLMRRLRFGKSTALIGAALLLLAVHVALTLAVVRTGSQMRAKRPVYELRIQDLNQHVSGFLTRHGIESADESVKGFLSSGRIMQMAKNILPKAAGLISDRLLILFMALLFLLALLDPEQENSPATRALANFGKDIQHYIATTAETGAIIAAANFLVLTALGVDFAFVWCLAYFFLHFIPNVGFIAALVPPTLLALLMLGWKKALLVLGCLILTEILGTYVLNPILLKKGLKVSVIEVMLSLLVWGFLLGPAGVILSVPLTLALRRFIGGSETGGNAQVLAAVSA